MEGLLPIGDDTALGLSSHGRTLGEALFMWSKPRTSGCLSPEAKPQSGEESNRHSLLHMFIKFKTPTVTLSVLALLAFLAAPARPELISVSASGTINANSSTDTTIPAGTPWTFELIYDTAAPDLDFEITGVADPTFGRFTNGGIIPALRFFSYRAGDYQVTIETPDDFGPFSAVDITFLGVHAIDININAVDLFPTLGGRSVSFHADFNDSSHSAFTSDALPANTALGLQSFQDATVELLPANDGVVVSTQTGITQLTFAEVPEPSPHVIMLVALSAILLRSRLRRSYTLCRK